MKPSWIATGIAIAVGIGSIVAIGVLVAYWYYLGPVSKLATDWGSFGSVMSGAFTLLSSFATIGTLLFLYIQQIKSEERQIAIDNDNKEKQIKHDEVVQKQVAALTFEQYLNHRKVFIERLQEQAIYYKQEIAFFDPDRVYNAIFPNNSPHNCEYRVDTSDDLNARPHGLRDCLQLYEIIGNILEGHARSSNVDDLIFRIYNLQDHLGIRYINPATEGDILFLNQNTGINLYNISKAVRRVERVLDSILFYAGHKSLDKISHLAEGHILRDRIAAVLVKNDRHIGSSVNWGRVKILPFLHRIYEISQNHVNLDERILDRTFIMIQELFNNPTKINELAQNEYAGAFLFSIEKDVSLAYVKHGKNEDWIPVLESVVDNIRAARHILEN